MGNSVWTAMHAMADAYGKAFQRIHERLDLVEGAAIALGERTGTRSASGYETRSMMTDSKVRLRSANGQWLLSEQGRAEGAAAARRMPTGRARWDAELARWVAA